MQTKKENVKENLLLNEAAALAIKAKMQELDLTYKDLAKKCNKTAGYLHTLINKPNSSPYDGILESLGLEIKISPKSFTIIQK